MRYSISILGVILLGGLSVRSEASPIHRHHHPWMMIGSHHENALEPEKVSVVRHVSSVKSAPIDEAVPVSNGKGSGDKIAQQAMRYQGTRYKWGGTNKKGVDCSGLVMRVFEDLKMKRLPHASAELYNAGEPVKLNNLQPGDLVFFKNTYRHGISHVGVYAGHNKFIHAADSHHGVMVTALSDPYFQLHYAGARRLY